MEAQTPAQQIIAAFKVGDKGGYRPLQNALGLASPNSVQYWEKSGRILEHYKPRIREAAKKLKVKLPPKAVFDLAFVPSNRRIAA